MRRACITLVACSVLALATAACGGASSATPAAASEAPAASPGSSVTPTGPDDGNEYASRAPGTPPTAVGCAPADGTGAVTVDIAEFRFAPVTVSIRAGETVTWTNGDAAPHTATVASIAGCTTGTIAQDAAATLRFDTPGTYTYACAIHPAMTGTVEVGG